MWIVRYVYVPLGGTRTAMYNIWIVFTFVAVWHDINLKLLAWGWLISLFILPEIIAGKVFSKEKVYTLLVISFVHVLFTLASISNTFNFLRFCVLFLVGLMALLPPSLRRGRSRQHHHDDDR